MFYIKGLKGERAIDKVPWNKLIATMIYDIAEDLSSKNGHNGYIDGCISITPENEPMYRLSFILNTDLTYLLGANLEDMMGKRIAIANGLSPKDLEKLLVKECFRLAKKNKFVEMTDGFKKNFNSEISSRIDWSKVID